MPKCTGHSVSELLLDRKDIPCRKLLFFFYVPNVQLSVKLFRVTWNKENASESSVERPVPDTRPEALEETVRLHRHQRNK
jgi:hypothetical protein